MPCTDWSDYSPKVNIETLERVEAMLCGVMRALEDAPDAWVSKATIYKHVLSFYNGKHSGVSKRDLIKWWTAHKKKDLTRSNRS